MKPFLIAGAAWNAASVSLYGVERSPYGCDDVAQGHAATLIGRREWEALEDHPCIPRETLLNMAMGVEDPADAVEFLGRRFADVLRGERQAPMSLLSVDTGRISNEPSGQLGADANCTKKLFPKIIYIGVGHSGSTTLADAMDLHPDMSFGAVKEHNFLWHYDGNKKDFLRLYKRQFSVDCGAKVAFDASPRSLFIGLENDSELLKSPIAQKYGLGLRPIKALKDVLGADMKFMVMFRDPVPWAMSNHVPPVISWSDLDNTTRGRLKSSDPGISFPKIRGKSLTKGMFAKRACYANALENWLKVFPKKNFLFLKSESFFEDPQETLDTVFDFAGVPRRTFRSDEVVASGRRRNSAKAQNIVHSRFHTLPGPRDCRERLEKMTGLDFGWEDEVPAESGAKPSSI